MSALPDVRWSPSRAARGGLDNGLVLVTDIEPYGLTTFSPLQEVPKDAIPLVPESRTVGKEKPRLRCDGAWPAHWLVFPGGDRLWLRSEYFYRWDCPCGEWSIGTCWDMAAEQLEDHMDSCDRRKP